MATTHTSRSATFLCTLMLGVTALAGCKGGGGSKSDSSAPPAAAAESPPPTGGSQTNNAPKISGSAPSSAALNSNYSFTPVASDADGDTLMFQIENKPAWATFNTLTGQLTGQPTEGTFANIVISTSDGKLTVALPPFSIEVGPGTQPPGTDPGATATATLTWIAPTQNVDGSELTDLAGFVVSYGLSSTTLTQSVRIDNPSIDRYVVEGLVAGETYYFGVRAVSENGTESELSEVVNKTT